jgi:hypothetical protein
MVTAISDPVFKRDDPRVKSKTALEQSWAIPGSLSNPITDLARSEGDTGTEGFERLRLTRQEAEAIIEVLGARRSLKALDFDTSRATVEKGGLDQ